MVQRTIMRADQELDIRPLYVTGLSGFGGGESMARQSGAGDAAESPVPGSAEAREAGNYGEKAGASANSSVEGLGAFGKITGELGATALPLRRITFGTYFNAFPASYWRRWTNEHTVRLVASISGQGTLIVYRSTAKGHVLRAEAAAVSSEEPETVEFDLPLKPFIDGGWYWFDIEAGDEPMRLHSAVWGFEKPTARRVARACCRSASPPSTGPTSVSTSCRSWPRSRPSWTSSTRSSSSTKAPSAVVDHAQYEEAQTLLGAKLRIIEQGNLGGSGGFSRVMNEVASKGIADYVLLLDDDVVCELEGILRAVAFADLAKDPTLVGGQMFSLYDRSVMHAFGETVAKYRWFWGPAPNTLHGHNFAAKPLRSTQWLHRRVDVDYNGWWMCLIPTKVIKEIGLALPMFIKWDDAEFGLRARDVGYPTVTLPGVAVWHVPWHEKDDTIDWQAYFHRRNRIITALLHSPYDRGGRLILESFETQIKHLLSMQYGPAEMGLMAIEDILEGPQRMHRDVLKRLPELFELRKGYDDSRSQTDLDLFPAAGRKKPPRRGKEPTAPKTKVAKVKTLVTGAVRQVMPVRSLAKERPEANVAHIDLKWWLLAQFDSALVSSADGSAASWYKRDPELFRDLLSRSVALHSRLVKEWPTLVEQYKAALPELSSPDTWKSTFDESVKKDISAR